MTKHKCYEIIIGDFCPPLRVQLISAGIETKTAEKLQSQFNVINCMYLLGMYDHTKRHKKLIKLGRSIKKVMTKSRLQTDVLIKN